ncbi:hypothetical protein ACIBAH_22045 [Streptomyces sp. NPDC051445]|uniref:hypothetical protein n=1 Tax=Streptomyces sp. NPDC051445 TaxID=3365653 RepID=UPI00379F295D
MTETFDIHHGLSAALRDRAEAWRFIAGFAAYWGQPLKPGDGWSSVEVETAERRLGLALPTALREAYRSSGAGPTSPAITTGCSALTSCM